MSHRGESSRVHVTPVTDMLHNLLRAGNFTSLYSWRSREAGRQAGRHTSVVTIDSQSHALLLLLLLLNIIQGASLLPDGEKAKYGGGNHYEAT